MDKWLNNKNVVRILSLVLAILLWAVVNREEQTFSGNVGGGFRTETITNVSITETGLDRSRYYLKSVDTAKVNLILTGFEADLRKVDPNKYKIVMDLSNLSPGEHHVRLKDVDFPPGVHVEIVPRMVTVVIERLQRIEVPVTIRTSGKPKEGYVAGQPVVTPEKVHAIVPASQADQVYSANGLVRIDQADRDVTQQVKLSLRDEEGNEIEGDIHPKVVDVKVPVSLPYKVLPIRVNLTGNPADGYSIAGVKSNVDEVKVFAPGKVLETLDVYDGVSVDVSGLTASKSFDVRIPLQQGVVEVEPEGMSVEVSVVPSAAKKLTNVPVAIVGRQEGTKAQFVTPENGTMDVTLEGAPNLLNQLRPEDVKLFVDISHLLPGTHELPLGVNLPPYIHVVGLENAKVTIDIAAE